VSPRQELIDTDRDYRYRITEAWGDYADKVGTVLVSEDRGEETQWDFINTKTGEYTGGMYGEFIGRLRSDLGESP
jgi:hypothetical protein